MNIFVKVLAPIVSAFIFSLFLASESVYFSTVFWISVFVFFIVGTIFSVAIEYKTEKFNRHVKYFISCALYGGGGIIIILLASLIMGSISEIAILPLLILGALPGLLYFHISLLLMILWKHASNILSGALE